MRIAGPSVGYVATPASQTEPLPLQSNGRRARYCMIQATLPTNRVHFGLGTAADTLDASQSPFVNAEATPAVIACGGGSNDRILFRTSTGTVAFVVTPVEL